MKGIYWLKRLLLSAIRPQDVSHYQYYESHLVKYKGNVYVGKASGLREKIIEHIHHNFIEKLPRSNCVAW